MKVGLEKLENHEGVAVRALLDSGTTGLFMDTTFAREKGFKMEKLKKPLLVRNVDGTVNAGGAIMYQVECNMFFKGHMERAKNGCMQLRENRDDTGNAVASSPQPRDRLGERRGRNDVLSTYMWKEKARREEKGSKESREG